MSAGLKLSHAAHPGMKAIPKSIKHKISDYHKCNTFLTPYR